MKHAPDDIVLVFCGIFAGLVFLWTHQSRVNDSLDFWLLFGGFMGMVCVPMFYSGYVYYKKNTKK